MREKLSATCKKLFDGELTIKKRELWLIGAVCLLVGIVYGLRKAPWTHGVTIGSNNGNQQDCTFGGDCNCGKSGCDCDAEECDAEECCCSDE